MKRILDFSSFLNESVQLGAKINLPPDVLRNFLNRYEKYSQKFEKTTYSRRILSQIENLPSFESLSTEDIDGDGYEEVVMRIDNKTIVFPYLKYDRNSDKLSLSGNFTNPTKDIIDFVDLLSSYGLMKKHLEGRKERLIKSLSTKDDYYPVGKHNLEQFQVLNNYCQSLIDNVIDEIKETLSKSFKTFNPFTDSDLYNNPTIKGLQKMGTVIDSSPIRVKNGTLVLKNPIYDYDIAITPSGYIRKAQGQGLITANPELVKPIYNEDDLNIKLSFLWVYTLKKKLKDIGLASKDIKSIVDTIGKNPEEYSKKVKEVVEVYPQLVTILPPPEEGFDPQLKRGVSLLDRFGVFD